MWIPLLIVAASMVVIWRACGAFEIASNYLGRDMTDGVKGATINAIGSSMPELFATIMALVFYLDRDGFAFGVGTTAGSAVFNAAIIPSLVIITVVTLLGVRPINVSRKVILRDGISLIIAELALIWVLIQTELNLWHGLFLMLLYLIYMGMTLFTMDRSQEPEEYEIERFGFVDIDDGFKATVLLLMSIVLIGGACHYLVDACYKIGDYLDIQVYFVSVILAAAATSVPDTIISIRDAMAGRYNDSVANALGSNIFDICFCLGFPLFMYGLFTGGTINMGKSPAVMDLRILLLSCTVAIFILMVSGRKLGIGRGSMMFGVYGFFLYKIITMAVA